ncbi:MAG TPA: PIG-L family deacetylase [Bryobacteraceae bacterium]|nr:PIG-L family deacetylase [Bryobacteraceae bacterium]
MRTALVVLAVVCPLWARLPLGKVPPGKTFLVVLPHHDDHTWDYGFGGLIAKFTDAGYAGYYVRMTNDEKDGALGWAGNNEINYKECLEAVRFLGMKDVISLNWRNDHSDSVPANEIRAQLILLIRKYRPQAVMAYDPWGHYDRNPDHRKSARAVADAIWAAGDPDILPEQAELGLKPWRVPYQYYSQRSDYGYGYTPNIAFELNESQMARKAKAYWMNRNVRLQPSLGRGIRAELARENLTIPELEGLSDLEATQKLQEWRMYWISEKRGRENGVKYAEVFDFVDEFDDLPAVRDHLARRTSPPEVPAGAALPQGSALVVTTYAEDYLLSAGGTLARMIQGGAPVYVLTVIADGHSVESDAAGHALGVKQVISLGYRKGELPAVSPTELRDRILFQIRRLKPRVLFIPNPYTHHEGRLDRLYAGSAAEEARLAAGLANFEPPFALAGLAPYAARELYYYSLPLDPETLRPEADAPFVPQPAAFDIRAMMPRKLAAVLALKTANAAVARDVEQRLARTGRKLDDASGEAVARIRVSGLGTTESFLRAAR